MSPKTDGNSSLYAVLIGIDCYLPNQLPGGYYYPSLGGCVRDITNVEDFLQKRVGLMAENMYKLTATYTGAKEPPEPGNKWPTYENMVNVFKEVTKKAKPGDQVYVHYSGHGGRAKTAYPDLKGSDGLDETLVPTDIDGTEGRYLRDVEIAHLIKAMVDKGILLTVVFDSCHSGGATRGDGGAVIRGIDAIDTSARPTESLVASGDDLAATWQTLSKGNTRAVKMGGGWLLEPQGYVLLAACRASESANEYAFSGHERNGALTYWMLDALKQIGPGMTYKSLHDQILTKVHSQFPSQTPQLQGDGNRVVFGSDRVQPYFSVPVMMVDNPGKRVLLNAGQAHGFRKGTQFAIYAPGDSDFSQKDKRLVIVEVSELGATDSWAKVIQEIQPWPVPSGAQAVLLDLGLIKLQRSVRVFISDAVKKSEIEEAVRQGGSGFIRLADGNQAPDFQVAFSADHPGEYEIWDPAGNTIRNLRPEIKTSDKDAAASIVQRLVHLAKYRNVQELSNNDVMSPLANKLIVEFVGVQADYDPADKPAPQLFKDPGNTPSVKTGEWVFLRVRNTIPPGKPDDPSKILNITVLDMQPDWGITQVFPAGAGYFEPLDPGKEILLPLRAILPDPYEDGTDTIKVFATLGTTNFRWLELPSLDQPRTKAMNTRSAGKPTDPLEQLLAAVSERAPATRNLDPAQYPSHEWITAQAELRIVKK